MRLLRVLTGGACNSLVRLVSAVTADWHVTPGKDVVSDGLLGAPAAEPPDGLSGFSSLCSSGSATPAEGVPSKAHPEGCLSDLPKQVRILAGCSLEQLLTGGVFRCG